MHGRGRDEVHVWRRGGTERADQGPERVRWAYAAFVPGDGALDMCMALLETHGDRAAATEQVRQLPASVLLIGPEQVRELGRQDPGLRRAIREARQAMRGGSRDTPRRMEQNRSK